MKWHKLYDIFVYLPLDSITLLSPIFKAWETVVEKIKDLNQWSSILVSLYPHRSTCFSNKSYFLKYKDHLQTSRNLTHHCSLVDTLCHSNTISKSLQPKWTHLDPNKFNQPGSTCKRYHIQLQKHYWPRWSWSLVQLPPCLALCFLDSCKEMTANATR